jgi:hypothetical protein
MSDHKTDIPQLSDIEERAYKLVQTLDIYLEKALAVKAERENPLFRVFLMEGNLKHIEDYKQFIRSPSNMDTIEYRSDKFYFWDQDTHLKFPIVSCKVVDSLGGDPWKVNFELLHPYTKVNFSKQGWMPELQFKQLCIFVISRANDTSFLGDFIANGIKPNLYRT